MWLCETFSFGDIKSGIMVGWRWQCRDWKGDRTVSMDLTVMHTSLILHYGGICILRRRIDSSS